MARIDYTREELVSICERAIVPESKWCDRDSAGAQRQVGETWALLRAGCDFEVVEKDGHIITDEHTIWVRLKYDGFSVFDSGADKYEELSYLPTTQHLDERNGEDWY